MSKKDKFNLLSIIDSISTINKACELYIKADDLLNDKIRFDAVMMNFIIIGEMVERISDELKKQYNHINWVKIKNLRNIIAHNYFGIDAEEVWQIIKNDLPDLKIQIEKIIINMNN